MLNIEKNAELTKNLDLFLSADGESNTLLNGGRGGICLGSGAAEEAPPWLKNIFGSRRTAGDRRNGGRNGRMRF